MMFIIILFVVLVGGGWLLGKGLGEALFPSEKKETYTFNSTHVHHHHHEHKNISIIDDQTKEDIIVYQKSIDLKK